MIAITGANGQLGTLVVKHLVELVGKEQIVALVREPKNSTQLASYGIQVRTADYDREETLNDALQGVTSLLLISSSAVGSRVEQHAAVLRAAEKNNVKNLAYTSILAADTNPMILATEHRETEQLIAQSDLNSVILRNGWYTENYTQGLEGVLQSKTLPGVSTTGRISSAARNDYAQAAATVLAKIENHLGKTYELAGDTGFTLTELAAQISAVAGTHIDFAAMSKSDYHQLLVSFGLPSDFAFALADSDEQANSGWLQNDSKTLSQLIGRPTQSLETALRTALNQS